ncbi:MAG: hypothetical protein ACOZNI_25260 [Myxococcota bacterium]
MFPWVLALVAGCATNEAKTGGSPGEDLDEYPGEGEEVAVDDGAGDGWFGLGDLGFRDILRRAIDIKEGTGGLPSVFEGDADTDADADADADADTDTGCPPATCDDVDLEECCEDCEECEECPPIPAPENRMTGGGILRVDGNKNSVSHGFQIRCDAADERQNLEINWNKSGGPNSSFQFHLLDMLDAECIDEGDETPPVAGFTTYIGRGEGRCDEFTEGTVEFVFRDFGEPGRDDEVWIEVTCDGDVAVDVFPDDCDLPDQTALAAAGVSLDCDDDTDNVTGAIGGDIEKVTGNHQAH